MNSSQLRSFFYGTLLGDSYIHNNIFYCKQISKDLIEFKYNIIKQYLPDSKPKIHTYEAYIDKNGVSHQKYYVLSAHGEYIKKLYKLFYPNGKKIIPPNVISKLDDLGFAMWYADDGCSILVQYNPLTGSSRSRRVQICTDSFSEEEHNNIIIPEMKQHGFEVSFLRRGELCRLSLKNLKKIQIWFTKIGEYFYNYFPSLLYKLDLGYRNDSLLKRGYVTEEYYNYYIKISAHPLFIDRIKIKEDIVQTTTLKNAL